METTECLGRGDMDDVEEAFFQRERRGSGCDVIFLSFLFLFWQAGLPGTGPSGANLWSSSSSSTRLPRNLPRPPPRGLPKLPGTVLYRTDETSYVCVYGDTYSKSMDQPGKVANPARGQPNRENEYFPVRIRVCEFGLARRVRQSCHASACSSPYSG